MVIGESNKSSSKQMERARSSLLGFLGSGRPSNSDNSSRKMDRRKSSYLCFHQRVSKQVNASSSIDHFHLLIQQEVVLDEPQIE